jgi:hypothetical protein
MVRLVPEPQQADDGFESKQAEERETQMRGSTFPETSLPSDPLPLHSSLSITFDASFGSGAERQSEEVDKRAEDNGAASPPLNEGAEERAPHTLTGGSLREGDSQSLSLHEEIERLRRDLRLVSDQRDNLRDEVDDLRMKLEIATGERNEFLRQVSQPPPLFSSLG